MYASQVQARWSAVHIDRGLSPLRVSHVHSHTHKASVSEAEDYICFESDGDMAMIHAQAREEEKNKVFDGRCKHGSGRPIVIEISLESVRDSLSHSDTFSNT